MIDALRTDHPKFDLGMELACSLPCEPCAIAVDDLVRDFGLRNQAEARGLLALSGANYAARKLTNQRSLGVPKKHWPNMQRACEKYWKRVYGE